MLATDERWLSIEDLAARYNVSESTVRTWRREGSGPRGHRLGKHVRFKLSDIRVWEDLRADPAQPA